MNKKELGSALRRGFVAGTIAGSLAGWASFAGAAAPKVDAAHASGTAPTGGVDLPPIPALPALKPLPQLGNVRVTTGADIAVPAFKPLPAPPRVSAPTTTTRGS